MFPARYFPSRFFADRYWPKVGGAAPVGAGDHLDGRVRIEPALAGRVRID